MLLLSIRYFFVYNCMVKKLGWSLSIAVFLFVFSCFAEINAHTQDRTQPELPSRKGKFYLVPELWLTFGTRTYIEVAPLVGYHVSDRFSVGLGPHYLYQAQKATPYFPVSFKTHIFGGKGFARYTLITHAESFLPINLFNELFAPA